VAVERIIHSWMEAADAHGETGHSGTRH